MRTKEQLEAYKKEMWLSFLTKAKSIHNNQYSYESATYIRSDIKISIICPIHGEFKQTPAMHLSGQKCPKCAIIQRSKKRASNTDQFIETAIKVHGDLYNYSKVSYINSHTKVKILCNSCNKEFLQNPDDHLQGHGCKNCCKYGIKLTKPVIFYVLKLKQGQEEAYKIGISNYSTKKRYKSDNPHKSIVEVLLEICFLVPYDAVLFEKQLKDTLKPYKYTKNTSFFGKTKNTEVVTIDPLPYVFKTFQLKD